MTREKSKDSSEVTIITLTKDTMLENYDRIKELLDLIPGRKWSREEIMADRPMKWDYSLLAMSNKKIVGVWLISKKGDTRHHHMIVVDEEYTGLGIGREMTLKSALAALESGEDYITTKVAEGLEASMNFQLKLGFTVYGEEHVDEEGLNYFLLRAAPGTILSTLDTK